MYLRLTLFGRKISRVYNDMPRSIVICDILYVLCTTETLSLQRIGATYKAREGPELVRIDKKSSVHGMVGDELEP